MWKKFCEWYRSHSTKSMIIPHHLILNWFFASNFQNVLAGTVIHTLECGETCGTVQHGQYLNHDEKIFIHDDWITVRFTLQIPTSWWSSLVVASETARWWKCLFLRYGRMNANSATRNRTGLSRQTKQPLSSPPPPLGKIELKLGFKVWKVSSLYILPVCFAPSVTLSICHRQTDMVRCEVSKKVTSSAASIGWGSPRTDHWARPHVIILYNFMCFFSVWNPRVVRKLLKMGGNVSPCVLPRAVRLNFISARTLNSLCYLPSISGIFVPIIACVELMCTRFFPVRPCKIFWRMNVPVHSLLILMRVAIFRLVTASVRLPYMTCIHHTHAYMYYVCSSCSSRDVKSGYFSVLREFFQEIITMRIRMSPDFFLKVNIKSSFDQLVWNGFGTAFLHRVVVKSVNKMSLLNKFTVVSYFEISFSYHFWWCFSNGQLSLCCYETEHLVYQFSQLFLPNYNDS